VRRLGTQVTAVILGLALAGKSEARPEKKKTEAAYAHLDDAALSTELARVQGEGGGVAEVTEKLTRGLLGAPYVLSPLGEEEAPDSDPRFRLDAFDCTTFVETALALSRSSSATGARAALERIRYSGPPHQFAHRRHLIVGQWVPGLSDAGWIEDVTERVGGAETAHATFELSAERWRRRRIARQLELDASEIPTGTFRVPYLPLSQVMRKAASIPSGTVLNVVREDVPWSPVLVTHQGLVFALPSGARVVRHASPIAGRVIDEPLEHMVQRYRKPNPWRIVGFELLQIRAAASSAPKPAG
jgi:hypothetical protein